MLHDDRTTYLTGIGLKIGATFFTTATIAAIKLLDDDIPLGQIVFARAFPTLPIVCLFLVSKGTMLRSLQTREPFSHLFRGLIGGLGMLAWFSAVQRLPLSDAQAIAFASPLIGVILAVLMLKEKVQIYRWSAVVIGFLGVIMILSEHLFVGQISDRDPLGALFALVFAGLLALASIQVRKMTNSEGTEAIVLYFALVTSVFGLMTLPFGWVVPDLRQALLLLFIGIAGAAAQLTLTHALKFSEASALALFDYVSMLWVIAFGILIFDEIPSGAVLGGSAIIAASGIFVMLRERAIRRRDRL
ncbi:MAG TPA: DMT family transporter [Pseudorhizobium sp.]|nr:DMT family transporter [Pseudorhizobium sp.]